MKPIKLKLFKWLNYLSIGIALALSVFLFVNLFGLLHSGNEHFLIYLPNIVLQPLLVVFSLIITIKSSHKKGVILFALFLSFLAMGGVLGFLQMMNADWAYPVLINICGIATGTFYIKSLQVFPRQITKKDVESVYAGNKILSGYTNWAIKDYTWIVFPIIIGGTIFLNIGNVTTNIFILLTGLMGFYVSYKKSTSSEKNTILWLFWGVITYTFLWIITIIAYFSFDMNYFGVNLTFNIIFSSVIFFALGMSLFFSNAFDTGVLIRRTVVDGSIFILIILVYNTIEHYFLHWVSHRLGLSDVFLSSFLSGILVLVFSPLHHKLEQFFYKKKSKGHKEDNL